MARTAGPLFVLVLFVIGLGLADTAHADQIDCTSDGAGSDSCTISFPNVLASATTYPTLQFLKGDRVTIAATGCAQTGGSGKTWKRFVDPSGPNSDHLYHGLISIPGITSGLVRLSSVVGSTTLPASTGGPLTLGYEDDQYDDNGYWSHDDGTEDQCSDQSGPLEGRAQIAIQIHRAPGLIAAAGTHFGQCQMLDALHETCHIDRPDTTHATEAYPSVQFAPGDSVTVSAGGCVQTGGSGRTWKRYVDPSGPNSGSLYHGLISIPGVTAGMVRISSIAGNTGLPVATGGPLTLGYEDDDYHDNGYWSHDDGTDDQCQGVGPAFLDIAITHVTPVVTVDGIEIVQEIQNMSDSVTLIANKTAWARVYLAVNDSVSRTVSATLHVQNTAAGVSVDIPSSGSTVLTPAAQLQARRESWTGSLNFPLPPNLTAAGAAGFTVSSVVLATGGTPLTCAGCNTARGVVFNSESPLRLTVIGLSYSVGTNVWAPLPADFGLLRSWLSRAYPVAQVDYATQLIPSTNPWPFDCNAANAQVAAVRGIDVTNGTDPRTHYLGFVSNRGGFMRGCASVPAAPDPTAVGSSPTGNPAGPGPVPVNVTGDTDASWGDWYGGHELSHTFGRNHPGFCNGNSASDPSFPNPNGQISDSAGSDTGLDIGDTAESIALAVLPGEHTFDIMTYCNQPQWLSAYTYEGIRTQLLGENKPRSGPGAPSGSGSHGRREPDARFIHVVASINLTRRSGIIRYVNPVRQSMTQHASGRIAALLAIAANGNLIKRYPVDVRVDVDVLPTDDQTAIVDATIPLTPDLARIRLLYEERTLAEFRASHHRPPSPIKLKVVRASAVSLNGNEPLFSLEWSPVVSKIDHITYTVEATDERHAWRTIGVGVKDAKLLITREHATQGEIRVIATNGFVDSVPAVIKSSVH